MIVEPLQLTVAAAFAGRNAGSTISADQIDAAEKRLGVALPEALRDYYLVASGYREMMDKDFHLLPPEKLRIEGDYLVFCEESQGGAVWGIHRNNLLTLPNPRVEGKAGNAHKWFSESSKLSAFLLGIGAWQALLSQEETARCELPEKQLKKIEAQFDYIGERSVRLGGHRVGLIYRDAAAPLIAAYLFNSEMLYVGTPEEGLIERIEELSGLDFEWL